MPVVVVPDLPPPQAPWTMVGPSALICWALAVEYQRDYGLRMPPVCGPRQTPCDVNRIHGGRGFKRILWAAQIWGRQVPPLPDSDTGSTNEVLLADSIGMPVPGKAPDGSDIVSVTGEYSYGLRVWPSKSDILTGALAPYSNPQSVTVYQLTPSNFKALFVGPSAAPAANQGVVALP